MLKIKHTPALTFKKLRFGLCLFSGGLYLDHLLELSKQQPIDALTAFSQNAFLFSRVRKRPENVHYFNACGIKLGIKTETWVVLLLKHLETFKSRALNWKCVSLLSNSNFDNPALSFSLSLSFALPD